MKAEPSQEDLAQENARLQAQLQELEQQQIHWKEVATENKRLLAVEQEAHSRAELARESASLLARVSRILSSSLDYRISLNKVVTELIPRFADWCTIDLLGEPNSTNLERVAATHRQAEKAELLRQLYHLFPLNLEGPHPVARVLREAKPLLKQPAGSATGKLTARSEINTTRETVVEQPAKPQNLQVLPSSEDWGETLAGSYLIVPLAVAGGVIGAVSFGRNESPSFQPFTSSDLTLAEDLASRVALTVQNIRLYQAAQHSLETQRELDYYKDLFFSMVSHELRTPLTSIKGYSQLVQRGLAKLAKTYATTDNNSTASSDGSTTSHPVNAGSGENELFAKEQNSLKIIVTQAERLTKMASELLDFTRIQNRKFEITYTTSVDLTAMIERVVEQQRFALKDHILLTQLEVTHLIALADEARLEQVLNNLITNALKYSPAGSRVTVGLSTLDSYAQADTPFLPSTARQTVTNLKQTGARAVATQAPELPKNQALIWIQDEGFGIAEEALENLFDCFYRVRTEDNKKIEGLGLGLYICQEIVRQHGGEIWVKSKVGQGSTFYFTIALESSGKENENKTSYGQSRFN